MSQIIHRLRPSLKFIHWNQEGWKTGLCSIPPLNQVSTNLLYCYEIVIVQLCYF